MDKATLKLLVQPIDNNSSHPYSVRLLLME